MIYIIMALINGPKIVTDGLITYYDPAIAKSYTTGFPTALNDILNNNNSTLENGSVYLSSNKGCIFMDGLNDYISLTSLITMLSSGYSIFAWININDFTTVKANTGRVFVGNSASTSTSMIAFFDGGVSFETLTNSSPHEIANRTVGHITDSNITAGNWFYFALVFDADVFYVYINGVLKGSGVLTDNLSFDRIGYGGGYATSYPAYFKGKISNFKVYNRGITSEEVFQNYNTHKSRFATGEPTEENLLAALLATARSKY